ncbi:hypothetical protein, conserved [Angomonas deanei]|uniref:Spliced leader RNA PSE-promoter transcription factor n=1 Tax=Angomonas deanei TaxID=59799 RepID=A0A7G2C8V9_9TRYP|nr:hypothetical protein, conserved [Angomonas deanei]
MQKSRFLRCSVNDLSGKPSAYYPKFRPRRLVMPVDPNNIYSDKRSKNPLFTRYKADLRRLKRTERQGALKLATVPSERSVGDAFRLMLKVSEEEKLFDPDTSESFKSLAKTLENVKNSSEPVDGKDKTTPGEFYAQVLDESRDVATATPNLNDLSIRQVDDIWNTLNGTPLNAPVLGVYATRGKAIVEMTIAQLAYQFYPRLRSKHMQNLMHECCGLLPCARISQRLGFGEFANVTAEINMWRELNILQNRLDEARKQASAALERVEAGVTQQRRWYWRGVLRSAANRLNMFPVEPSDLQPRLEWIRDSLYAFIFFLHVAEQSGEVGIHTETFIRRVFCSQLHRFAVQTDFSSQVECLLASQEVTDDNKRLLRSLAKEWGEERERGGIHPLNEKADKRRAQFESSGGAHATQPLIDDVFNDHQVETHRKQAPPLMLHALLTKNTLKETQIILKYAPDISPKLRNAPIDVDQVIRKTVDVALTNNYATLHEEQQYRQVEHTVCRLYAGKYCIGEGKGDHLMEAVNVAGQSALWNYYLQGRKTSPPTTAEATSPQKVDEESSTLGKFNVRSKVYEEELLL